ncbi:tetratricopeptide repeat protein [Streptomyces lasiicapitis]|uniref:tetratricopeptide repeat protein n=1 Tax=Streptomyces lasiicapitis TaxID=1923961 RepID=UPI00364F1952
MAPRGESAVAEAETVCGEGELALGRGDGGSAAEVCFRRALSLAPAPEVAARAHVGLGRVHLTSGDVDDARTEFQHAHDAVPDGSVPLFWLGCTSAHQGELAAADGYFTRSLACPAPHLRALVQRGYVRAKLGWWGQARADLRAAGRGGVLDAEGWWVAAVLGVGRPVGGADDGATPGSGVRLVGGLLRKAGLAALGGRAEWVRAAELFGAAWELDRGAGGFPALADGGFPALYGATLAVGGRRELAVELLDTAARRDPADHRVTHALAIALLNSHTPEAPLPQTPAPWEQAIAAWGALLHDEFFWERVRHAAGRRYGLEVGADLVPELRTGLRDAVTRRLPEEGTGGGRIAPDLLLQREADAARLLAEAGGFPVDRGEPSQREAPGRGRLHGGPLRIAALGRVREFGTFAAATESGRHPLVQPFSELGFAHLQLNAGQPADALAALTELRCRDCRARGRAAGAGGVGAGRTGETGGGPGEEGRGSGSASAPPPTPEPVCAPNCPRFDELNPGYAGLPDRRRRLVRDARELALHARVTLGRDELSAPRPDFDAAAACWRRALVHSRRLERYRHTQADIVALSLAAAKDAYRAGRLSLAVATLETTRTVIGANERPRLDGQLARVLADRGIGEANREEPALDESAADLRRSVALSPRQRRAQLSLGIVLRVLALRRWGSGSLSGARATLEEATERLTAALTHFPDDPEITEERNRAQSELDFVRGQFDESGR